MAYPMAERPSELERLTLHARVREPAGLTFTLVQTWATTDGG